MMPFYSLLILKAIILYSTPAQQMLPLTTNRQAKIFFKSIYSNILVYCKEKYFVKFSDLLSCLAQQMLRLMRHQFRISFNINQLVSQLTHICFHKEISIYISKIKAKESQENIYIFKICLH